MDRVEASTQGGRRWQGNGGTLARDLADVALAGAQAILRVVAQGMPERQDKADGSFFTQADLAAQDAILAELRWRLPGVAVIAEESAAHATIADGADFLLVDPLDGTRDFVAGRSDYSVNVAYVSGGRPVAGAIVAPALGLAWFGGSGAGARAARLADGGLAEVRAIACRRMPAAGLTVLSSRSHADPRTAALLARLPVSGETCSASAIKFCRLAEGEGDFYPRFNPTMEWDTAAGQAIVEAAGGVVWGEDGAPLTCGHADRDFRNGGFFAWGDGEAAARLMPAVLAPKG